MEPKVWWRSRTVIIGIVAALVGGTVTIANLITSQEVLSVETQASIVTTVAGLVMVVLRAITGRPIV